MEYKEVIKFSLDNFDDKYLEHKDIKNYKNKDLIAIIHEEDHENIWQWAWSLENTSNKLLNLSKKLLTYALDLDYKKDNQELKKLLLTSHVRYKSYTKFEILIAIALFLTKTKWFYQDKNKIYLLS